MGKFKTYEEAVAFINARSKKYFSNLNEYYASEEYKQIYPVLERLRVEKLSILGKKAKSIMDESDVKEGSCVEYSTMSPFGEIYVFEGKVKLDKYGIPYVHLKEAVGGKKKVRWHKGFRPMDCLPEETPLPK